MFDQQALALGIFAGANGGDDAFVVAPDGLQVAEIGKGIELDRLIGVPVGVEQTDDKRVVQTSVDRQVQLAVFLVGNLDTRLAQLLPGAATSARR